MRIKVQQFLFGKNHSWSVVGQNLGRAMIKLGHDVEFISTDGKDDKYIPQDLRPFVRDEPKGIYDCQLSYTAPHNWPVYLQHGNKNRFGIWNYEYNNKKSSNTSLLEGFAKYYKATSLVLPSSNFTKDVFLSMGIPEEKMRVIPHGINLEDFKNPKRWPLRSTKKLKILLNIAQPHRRKALHLALKAFGEAFTKDDDVVLIAKVFKQNNKGFLFDIDFNEIYRKFDKKYPKHASVEFVHDYIPNIADIYHACDINYSTTFAECWHLPSLEALASGIVNVVPRYGGLLDFCNNDNSLLIDGNIVRAPRDHQYWMFNPSAVHFEVDINSAINNLKLAVDDYDLIKSKFEKNMAETAAKFTWENAAKGIVDLCE